MTAPATVAMLAPLVVAGAVALLATMAHRRVRPDLAARLLASTLAAVTFAVVPALAVISLGFVTHVSWFGDALVWCRHVLGMHDAVSAWWGIPSVSLLVFGSVRAGRVLVAWRRMRRVVSASPEIVTSDALFAYTLPGPAGQMVLSSALVSRLDPDELAVVMAHERAHAAGRHDRYLLLGELAEAFVPFVRILRRRMEFALERWADEVSVGEVGGDRGLVASTLAKVAISRVELPVPVAAFTGLGVVARVQALHGPPPPSRAIAWAAGMVAGFLAVAIAGGVQLHHVWPLVVALCTS